MKVSWVCKKAKERHRVKDACGALEVVDERWIEVDEDG